MDCLEPFWMLPSTKSWCQCQHSTYLKALCGVHPASSRASHTYPRAPALLCEDLQILCCDSPKWLKQQFIFFNYWLEQLILPFGTANAAFWRLCFYCRGLCCDWVRALHLWMSFEVWPICLSAQAKTLGTLGSPPGSGGSRVLVVSPETWDKKLWTRNCCRTWQNWFICDVPKRAKDF